jgi:hypothetical protein
MKLAKVAEQVSDDVDGLDDELQDGGEDEIEGELVKQFIRMWPRAIFHTRAMDDSKGFIADGIPELRKPGVYILYRNGVPFYVGQAKNLRTRLKQHANGVISLKTHFWNHFSAFLVDDSARMKEVEAILISAMPPGIMNSSKPTLHKVPMNKLTVHLIRELRAKGQY